MASLEQYQDHLFNLMPRGLAWTRESNSSIAKLILAIAVELSRVDARVADLLREAYPGTTFELLEDWERVCGLPEPCEGAPTTLQARRDAILRKLLRPVGQSRQFFIDIAARVGFTITIFEPRPFLAGIGRAGDRCYDETWRYAWYVNGPEVTITDFRAGISVAGDPLRFWGNELLECIISRLKPAHTHVIFAYGEEE